MLKHILPLMPETIERYVEPFAGGASLFFALPEKPGYTVLNDTRDELINYYRIVQTRPHELQTLLNATLYAESDWRKARKISTDLSADPLERAWATHVKIKCSFAYKGTTFGRHATSAHGRNYLKFCLKAADRLRLDVEVHCEDALKCIRRNDSPQTFFFIDPPYPCSTLDTHWGTYNQDDWEQLVQLLDTIQGSYILCGYPNPVTPCADEMQIKRTSDASQSRKTVVEAIWTKFNSYYEPKQILL